jgi:hypothetical protein
MIVFVPSLGWRADHSVLAIPFGPVDAGTQLFYSAEFPLARE